MSGHETELHPLAKQALSLVEIKEPGQDSAIPAAKLNAFTKKLTGHKDDKLLFVHLCVLHVRLGRSGLAKAAEQFRDLASMGLKKQELIQTVERADKLRDASKSLNAPVPRSAAEGLRASQKVGVSLRGAARGNKTAVPGALGAAPRAPLKKS